MGVAPVDITSRLSFWDRVGANVVGGLGRVVLLRLHRCHPFICSLFRGLTCRLVGTTGSASVIPRKFAQLRQDKRALPEYARVLYMTFALSILLLGYFQAYGRA